jgi:hypothetical protein
MDGKGAWRDNMFVERVHSSIGNRTPNEAYTALLKTDLQEGGNPAVK